jgi:hypothetical protein
MLISKLVETAFRQSAFRNSKTHRAWIDASEYLGNQLPDSLLSVSIQRSGELDMLLRCMEEENVQKRSRPPVAEIDFSFHYQMIITELWVGQVYEFIRLLIERKLEPEPGRFSDVSHQLRLLRITIEKHEIAADRKLTKPINMQKFPLNNNESDRFVYSKDDPTRAHIMPASVSQRGSIMWHVIDILNDKTYCLERRELSDQILIACEKSFSDGSSKAF